jgi:cytosine/adenosine deaminase-related metal-dependent hydrolase
MKHQRHFGSATPARDALHKQDYWNRKADDLRLQYRIDRHIIRLHTPAGYDRCMELAAQDFARHVAEQVSPKLEPRVAFAARSAIFGRRMKFVNK